MKLMQYNSIMQNFKLWKIFLILNKYYTVPTQVQKVIVLYKLYIIIFHYFIAKAFGKITFSVSFTA